MAKNRDKKLVKVAPTAPAEQDAPPAEQDAPPAEQDAPTAEQKALAETLVPGKLAEGMLSYLALDPVTGSVFASEQKAARNYDSAVIADSPLGRKCVRLTSNEKAAKAYCAAINERGASACSNAIVVPVVQSTDQHREMIKSGVATWISRNSKARWFEQAHAQSQAKLAQAQAKLAEMEIEAANAKASEPVNG